MRFSALLDVARLGRSGIRRRPARALAVFAGIFAAALAFALLTSETASSDLAVTRTVRNNFRAAYEILVRPPGSVTSFERRHHLVDDGFLSGLFGGITMAQYRQIARLAGVSLAAPVADVGYFLVTKYLFVPLPKSLPRDRAGVYRVKLSWVVHHGLARYPGQTTYIYYTPQPLRDDGAHGGYSGLQSVPGGSRNVCGDFYLLKPVPASAQIPPLPGKPVRDPYRLEPAFYCTSPKLSYPARLRSVVAATNSPVELRPGVTLIFELPVLIAGVDPAAEERLVGLGHALTSGHYLRDGEGLSRPEPTPGLTDGRPLSRYYPVLASVDTFLDEAAQISASRLVRLPTGAGLADLLGSSRAYDAVTRGHGGRTLWTEAISPTTAWRAVLKGFGSNTRSYFSDAYWRVSPARYATVRAPAPAVKPRVVRNDPNVWSDNNFSAAIVGASIAPPGADDTWYRHLRVYGASGAIFTGPGGRPPPLRLQTSLAPLPRLVGTFNPARLEGFSPLSRVPLQTFYPPQMTAGDPVARRLLGGSPLGPTTDLGGYLTQPPLLLTTLQGAIALDNGEGDSFTFHSGRTAIHQEAYAGASPSAPISSIEVRVRGVHGPTPLSLARIKLVAEEIARRTGLDVTITAGSSPRQVGVLLASGRFGTPPLHLEQQWSLEDVDSQIIQSQDAKDLAVLALVALACILFVSATTYSGVLERRREIATFETVGWPKAAVVELVVGEAAQVGLLAGLMATAIAVVVSLTGSLREPALVLALITPLAVVLAAASAMVAVLIALRRTPLQGLTPSTMPGGRRLRGRSMAGIALSQLLQSWGRTLLAVATLALAVAVAASLLGIEVAFRGAVAHDLLGNAVVLYVRGADLVTVALVALVGTACVSDIISAGIRERRVELATLRATGWRERDLTRLTLLEGAAVGLTGSLLGAIVGAIALALLGGSNAVVIATIAIGILAGAAVSILALAVPALRAGPPLQESIAAGTG